MEPQINVGNTEPQMNTGEENQAEPPINADARRLDDITRKIIGSAYSVGNALGSGFLEKVYENALAHELRQAGLVAEQQMSITVRYRGVIVGTYAADLLVEDCVLVELKSVRELDEMHMAQCLNYLTATGLRVCLLINFGARKVQVRRVVSGF